MTMLTALIYILFFFFGAIKSLAGKPIWGLYIYFWSFYLHAPTQWWGAHVPDLRWSFLAAFISLLSLILHKKTPWRFWSFRENKLLTGLFVLVLLQWHWTALPDFHTEYVFLLLKFILFIFVVQNTLDSTDDIKKIFIANLIGGAYLAYLGISSHQGGRLGGLGTAGMDGANQLGQHFIVLLFMGSYLLLMAWNKITIIILGCLALILVATFLTESRGVIIAMFATGTLALFLIPKGTGGRFLLFACLAGLASAALMGPQIIERFKGMGTDSSGEMEDASAQSRWVIIDAQWSMLSHSPVIGHGHRGTLVLSPNFIPEEYHAAGTGIRASHNVAMSFLVDHGWLGFLLYFGAIVSACWRGWSVKQGSDTISDAYKNEHFILRCMLAGAVLALASFMLGGMFSNNKKLEADIWLLALIPIIHSRIMVIKSIPSDDDKER